MAPEFYEVITTPPERQPFRTRRLRDRILRRSRKLGHEDESDLSFGDDLRAGLARKA